MIKTLDPCHKPQSHKYFNETEMPKLYGQLLEVFINTTLHHKILGFEIRLLHNKCLKLHYIFAFNHNFLHLNLYCDILPGRDSIYTVI